MFSIFLAQVFAITMSGVTSRIADNRGERAKGFKRLVGKRINYAIIGTFVLSSLMSISFYLLQGSRARVRCFVCLQR
jgi:hypothetical protein